MLGFPKIYGSWAYRKEDRYTGGFAVVVLSSRLNEAEEGEDQGEETVGVGAHGYVDLQQDLRSALQGRLPDPDSVPPLRLFVHLVLEQGIMWRVNVIHDLCRYWRVKWVLMIYEVFRAIILRLKAMSIADITFTRGTFERRMYDTCQAVLYHFTLRHECNESHPFEKQNSVLHLGYKATLLTFSGFGWSRVGFWGFRPFSCGNGPSGSKGALCGPSGGGKGAHSGGIGFFSCLLFFCVFFSLSSGDSRMWPSLYHLGKSPL